MIACVVHVLAAGNADLEVLDVRLLDPVMGTDQPTWQSLYIRKRTRKEVRGTCGVQMGFLIFARPTSPSLTFAQLGKIVENAGAFGLLPLTKASRLRYEAEKISTMDIDLLSELDVRDGETYILVRHGLKLDVSGFE